MFYNDIRIRDVYTKNGLEEFIVESLTRPELMNVLNKIQASTEEVGKTIKIKKSGTLLQRIIKFVSELFGVNVNENSLLEQEYKLFGNIVQQEEVKQELEREQSTFEEFERITRCQWLRTDKYFSGLALLISDLIQKESLNSIQIIKCFNHFKKIIILK